MAKEVSGLIKLQIRGGAANPSPPVGPALGAKGVNIMEFCKQFNARTQDKAGKVLASSNYHGLLPISLLSLLLKLLPLRFNLKKLQSLSQVHLSQTVRKLLQRKLGSSTRYC